MQAYGGSTPNFSARYAGANLMRTWDARQYPSLLSGPRGATPLSRRVMDQWSGPSRRTPIHQEGDCCNRCNDRYKYPWIVGAHAKEEVSAQPCEAKRKHGSHTRTDPSEQRGAKCGRSSLVLRQASLKAFLHRDVSHRWSVNTYMGGQLQESFGGKAHYSTSLTPDFLSRFVALASFIRLSLRKAAHLGAVSVA